MSGNVRLEGRDDHIGASVTSSSHAPVFTDTDGNFQARLSAYTYQVAVEKEGFLPAVVTGLVVRQDTAVRGVMLFGEDISVDDIIDGKDLAKLARNFGRSDDALLADPNADGLIDISDLAIVAKNLGRRRSPWPFTALQWLVELEIVPD